MSCGPGSSCCDELRLAKRELWAETRWGWKYNGDLARWSNKETRWGWKYNGDLARWSNKGQWGSGKSTGNRGQMELSRDEEQRKRERAWIYGERAQPRSHFVKERLMGKLNGPNGVQEHGGDGNTTVTWPGGATKVGGAVVKHGKLRTDGAEQRRRAEEERKSMDIWGRSTAEEPFC
ncbi:hypothetical protein B0H14DRAFT_2605534 [Mycena olivaceomarginata]|nr:hypothetical protein B0H14DRAFT_2605534 [Mycena olivaceomarginata]